MEGIFPGLEYDIFISYRHNDNVYDGWVSEFVENLRKELVATVKDKLTVFFDENPEDFVGPNKKGFVPMEGHGGKM